MQKTILIILPSLLLLLNSEETMETSRNRMRKWAHACTQGEQKFDELGGN